MENFETSISGKIIENKEGMPKEMSIITHRGLNLEKENYFTESSREAFADQIARGFGLEFDLQFTKDGKMVVLHDFDLKRLTSGKNTRKISEINATELLEMDFSGCHLVSFGELLRMITTAPNNRSVNALHIKSAWQENKYLDEILKELELVDTEKFIVIDLKVEPARYLKGKNPRLHLAPSLSHPYDIERFNTAVGGTLLPIEEVIKNRDLYDWVWLDEWDRKDRDGKTKILNDRHTFETLKQHGFKIALVTPEMHKSSPGLLAADSHSHEDATTEETLRKRLKEILSLGPDAVCSDRPDLIKGLVK